MDDAEVKAIVSDIANKLFKIFNVDRFKELINRYVREKYDKGIEQIEGQLSINVDYGNNYRNTEMLNDYVFDNIKGMTDELQDKLRQELQRGILEQATPIELRKRVSDIFRGNNPTRFNFEDRMRMIVRTEGKRAINMAQFQGAMDSGRILYKYLDIIDDSRTSDICRKEDSKYGTQADAIPLRQQFKVTSRGKSYSAQYPPFHVNCRTSLIIVQSREED